MSEKVLKIDEKEKEKDFNSMSEIEIKADINMKKSKTLSLKTIEFIILFIIIILGLFFYATFLLISKNSKKKTNIVNEQLNQALRKTDPIVNNGLTPSSYEKQVLLITNHFSQNDSQAHSPEVLYNILKEIRTVNLTVIDPFDPDLNNKNISYLKNFNLVVLDFVDGGYDLSGRFPNFVRTLIQYINEGGALFSGHDQFENTHDRYITQEAKDMLSVLGFIHQNSWGNGYGSTAYFEKSAIGNSIFLTNYALAGDSIKIASTHQTYSRYNTSCQTCKVIMKFVRNGPDVYDYLVTNRPNRIGKTVNIRAGHSHGFDDPEKNIFLSSILWLLYEI
jgi:flagellar basal body-associated protein FliL